MDYADITITTYNCIAEQYGSQFKNDFSESLYIDLFLSLIEHGNILNIGCGIGHLSNYINKKGYNVTAIDASSNMLEFAKKHYKNVNFILTDMRSMVFEQSFFGITLLNSLFHLNKDELKNVMLKCYELLNKNGKMLLIMQEGVGEGYVKEPFRDDLTIYMNYYKLEELEKLLHDCYFQILYKKIEKVTGEYELGNNKIIIICEKIIKD